jgi:hypothetical protein
VKFLKDYAIGQIARFSHTKDKAAVLAYVDAGFDVTGPPDTSALTFRFVPAVSPVHRSRYSNGHLNIFHNPGHGHLISRCYP